MKDNVVWKIEGIQKLINCATNLEYWWWWKLEDFQTLDHIQKMDEEIKVQRKYLKLI